MTGLPLNLFLHPSFAQPLSVSVGEDGGDDGITAITRRPTELDIGPPGIGVVLRANEVHLAPTGKSRSVGTCRPALGRLTERNREPIGAPCILATNRL